MNKVTLILLSTLFLFSCKKEEAEISNKKIKKTIDPTLDTFRINQVQCIGSHNSYRIKTDEDIFNLVTSVLAPFLPDDLNPKEWDYTHIPITQQLDLGLRSFELDLYYDPTGGRYYNRFGNVLVGKNKASGIPALNQPGMKLLHIPDVDYNTHHYTFKDALFTIKNWSLQNPTHLPIIILVEDKEFAVGDVIPFFAKALPFDKAAVDALEQEVIDVFGNSNQLFKPDDLRKSYPNLKTAIQTEGWPMIKDMRGKIIIVFYENSNYTIGHPNLENKMMFQFSSVNSGNGAFVIVDNSSNITQIKNAVNSGAMVRTRSDAGTDEARTGNTTSRENAFNSGAQIISTDYYIPDKRAGTPGWTNYQAIFPQNNYARMNVLNAPEEHQSKPITE